MTLFDETDTCAIDSCDASPQYGLIAATWQPEASAKACDNHLGVVVKFLHDSTEVTMPLTVEVSVLSDLMDDRYIQVV